MEKLKPSLPPNSLVMLDYLAPVIVKVYDKDELKYKDEEAEGEFTDEVFVFDIKEIRIKWFFNLKTKIKIGKAIQNVDTCIIHFTDDHQILVRGSVFKLFTDFIPEYLTKLNNYFPDQISVSTEVSK